MMAAFEKITVNFESNLDMDVFESLIALDESERSPTTVAKSISDLSLALQLLGEKVCRTDEDKLIIPTGFR